MGFGLRVPNIRVRGLDVAGRVEAVGANVRRFHPGDEVFGACDGSFAEYAGTQTDRLAPKPANLSFEQAAAVPISGVTALQALRDKGEIQAGQHILIIGAGGGVGTFATQLGKVFGAEVTAVCSTTKTDLVRSIGADHVIDYTREDFTDGRHRCDLILDTAGNRPLTHLRRALTPHGTLIIVGGEKGGRWLGGFQRQIVAAPLLSPFMGQKLRPLVSTVHTDDLQVLRELIEAGKLTPVIDRSYPLSDTPDAIRKLPNGHTTAKTIVTL